MSLDGQVLCQRMLTGPCALATFGAATAAVAVAAPAASRNLRRDVFSTFLVMRILPSDRFCYSFEGRFSCLTAGTYMIFQRLPIIVWTGWPVCTSLPMPRLELRRDGCPTIRLILVPESLQRGHLARRAIFKGRRRERTGP